MQINLSPEHTKELKRIKAEAKGLFSVSSLVNLIIDHWLFLRENEEKLKELYAHPKRLVPRK